jgi:hypothetical protein
MRRDDWVEQMWLAIEDHADTEFVWGVNDCCLFVARVVDAMTDSDIETQLNAAYTDEETALAYIASFGSLEAAVSSHLGQPEPGRPLRGDVVLIDGGDGPALGILVGGYIAGMGPNGFVYLPRSEALQRWAIQ